MLYDSDGRRIVPGRGYRVSWQKWAGSVARYNFNCKAEIVGGIAVLIDQRSHKTYTEAYLRMVQAKIHLKK